MLSKSVLGIGTLALGLGKSLCVMKVCPSVVDDSDNQICQHLPESTPHGKLEIIFLSLRLC